MYLVLDHQYETVPPGHKTKQDIKSYIYEDDLQLGKLKENCLLLKLYRKLRKMFLSPRRESNPQASDIS